MPQWPFKIEKGVGGNEKKRPVVLPDEESKVGGDMSRLPDEILECILNKLILRDAVRAGLVSSRWRHLVLSRPCLVFKTCSLFQIEGASKKKCVCSEYKDRFVQAVYEFMASYRGARMKRLFVRFCAKIVSRGVVSDWMRFALDLGVEVVKLEFYCKYFEPKVPFRVVPQKIPIEFPPSKQPVVVKYLELSHCNAFTLSLFTQLETLKFHHIYLNCHGMESVLSSGLVNLKTLKFSHSKLPPYLSLNSLPGLKHFLALSCSGLEKIDVASLKLNTLEVISKRSVSLVLTQVPNLKVLTYSVDARRSLCHIFTKLPQILPQLTTLNVHTRSNWIEYMPESIATFSSLRRLRLALGPRVGDIMFKIVQFLKSCPLLSHLAIVVIPREDREHEKLECIDEYHHEHLEWIKIFEFVGTKYQIECCKYLLKLAPHAKQLILEPGEAYFDKAGHRIHPVSEEERETVVNALKPFLKDVKLLVL